MFDSLDDQIKHDTEMQTSRTQRMLVWVAVAVISVLVFGGLYFAVRMLE